MSQWLYVALIPLALSLPAAAAELPCQLTEPDYTALAQSKSHLDRAGVQSKTDEEKQDICVTRRFANRVSETQGRGLTRDDVPDYDPQYLTDSEYRTVRNAISDILIRSLPAVLRPTGTA